MELLKIGCKNVHCVCSHNSDCNTQTLPPNINRGRSSNQARYQHQNQSSQNNREIRQRSSSENRPNNVSSVEEDIVIYRLPGEKLGLGLRFDGGGKAQELVHRLFVQCCSKGSPSARTKCTWGTLSDGDEIVSISSKLVRRMTRVDCVKALKGMIIFLIFSIHIITVEKLELCL